MRLPPSNSSPKSLPAHPWKPGAVVLGKYTIVERVGRGGMATVYAARHRNGKRVAIKALHPVHHASDAAVARFFREGVIANLVEHPGALEVYDEGRTDEGACVLVCEYLEGCTLHELQQSSGEPLSLAEVIDVLFQVLDVLVVAHAAGVIHRDIKPANLFLTTASRIKLLDFGVARSSVRDDEAATVDGELLGTPAFMSPEQAGGIVAELDATSDLWSLSATAMALLSGKVPREGRSVSEVLMAAISLPLAPARQICPSLPEAVAAVLDRAVARDRSERFPTAMAFRDALSNAAPSGDARALSGEEAYQRALEARRARPGMSSKRLKMAAAALPLIIALAIGMSVSVGASRSGVAPLVPTTADASSIAPVRASEIFADDAGVRADASAPIDGRMLMKSRPRVSGTSTNDAAAPRVTPSNELDRRY